MNSHMVRIAAGCSADITLSIPQMARYGEIDYLVLDYLMEHSIARMAAARDIDADGGFGTGILGPEIAGELGRLLERGVKIITNAGGLNPQVCADKLQQLAAERGLHPRIAVVHGDDVRQLTGPDHADMFNGAALPRAVSSSNAYLGAAPIAQALEMGAQIVVTGRVVDSALTLGPLLHEFGWSLQDYDLMATGSIVGHLLECGAQPSGGIHTDWRDIDFVDSSFPIAEVHADGEVVLTKVPGTGGRISFGTIAEQLTYEIGDPQRYFLPDVTADFSQVALEEIAPDRIRLTGARGYAPTPTYKVCCIEQIGWRGVIATPIGGKDAIEKARKTASAVIRRTETIIREHNWGEFDSAGFEIIGSGETHGAHARPGGTPEVVYRVVADHPRREAVETLLRVNGAVGPSMAPGTSPPLAAEVKPRMKLWSFLLGKDEIVAQVTLEGQTVDVVNRAQPGFRDDMVIANAPLAQMQATGGIEVPLERIAFTRSGDKGDMANIGIVARKPEFLPYINAALTSDVVRDWYRHVFADYETARVERFAMPGINALNFLLHNALDGGAVESRRFDDMGKSLGQLLLDFPVTVPGALLDSLPAA